MKKTQLDRAIDALEAKKADVLTKANAEAAAFDHAIQQLKAQRIRRTSKPRVLDAPAQKVG